MDTIEQQLAEIEQLKAKQALHRQQLAENRQRALEKKTTQNAWLISVRWCWNFCRMLRL